MTEQKVHHEMWPQKISTIGPFTAYNQFKETVKWFPLFLFSGEKKGISVLGDTVKWSLLNSGQSDQDNLHCMKWALKNILWHTYRYCLYHIKVRLFVYEMWTRCLQTCRLVDLMYTEVLSYSFKWTFSATLWLLTVTTVKGCWRGLKKVKRELDIN